MKMLTSAIRNEMLQYQNKINDQTISEMFEKCFMSTIDSTVESFNDDYYVITGDIPAMWLRDSSAQVNHYCKFSNNIEIQKLIKGVINTQFKFIEIDPYANAFNKEPNGHGENVKDNTLQNPWIWERKYEIDSLCYPIKLLLDYLDVTKDYDFVDESKTQTINNILDLFIVEQNHEKSDYTFQREVRLKDTDTLFNDGKGAPVSPVGLVWSGFRPSDDACTYGYLIPANMFIVTVLTKISKLKNHFEGVDFEKMDKLINDINAAIEKFAIIKTETNKSMFAYEVDGFGNELIMDDANVPSLLSLPYLGYCDTSDELYKNTRSVILSESNPYYYEGKKLSGIGSPHTEEGFVWHIALCMQALTSTNKDEKLEILNTLINTTGGTGYMHESINANDDFDFSRSWFSWANTLFAELVMQLLDEGVEL